MAVWENDWQLEQGCEEWRGGGQRNRDSYGDWVLNRIVEKGGGPEERGLCFGGLGKRLAA